MKSKQILRYLMISLFLISVRSAFSSANDSKFELSSETEKEKITTSNLRVKSVASNHSVTINTEFISECTLSNDDFELDSGNRFFISPNPAKDKISIVNFPDDVTEARVTIISVLGRIVKKLKVNTENRIISFEDLRTGLYFVTLKSDNKEFTTKIIVSDN